MVFGGLIVVAAAMNPIYAFVSPQVGRVGVGAMGTGGLIIALTSVNFIRWGRRLADYSSFYI